MKLKINIIILLLLFAGTVIYGQMAQYEYVRPLQGVSDQWHRVALPDEIFGKISAKKQDIRIFGVTSRHDTLEVPYLWKIDSENKSTDPVQCKIINTSRNEKGYYFTLEVPSKEAVNQVELLFRQQNFDWKLTLEGSQDQLEWFTLREDYRILSIKNALTDYQFTKVDFPDARYPYLRLLIKSTEKPDLTSVSLALKKDSEISYRDYPVKSVLVAEDKKARQTFIDLDLDWPVPVSYLKIAIKDTFDYYRPITMKYLSDSTQTEQGWHYDYRTMATGTLSSLEANVFIMPSIRVQKLKILIDNYDNKPLTVNAVTVKGYFHELIARFTEPADYFLAYGNATARQPHYDIGMFTDNIPENLMLLELGDEQTLKKETSPQQKPLFENKNWLWGIMVIVILVLGWFSIKMIREG